MIELKNVTKTYLAKRGAPFEALKGVSLSLPSRGMVFLLGKSGSGKTTLLNIIGLLDRPTTGSVEIDGVEPRGKEVDDFRNRFSGFVFQDFALIEEETVGRNVALALQMQSGKDVDERVAAALEKVGLSGYERRFPHELSGGEMQRVAIARAIAKDSEMILADEPTGNLDSETGAEIFRILRSLSAEKLVVVVSHDREFAEKYADRIVELRDGRIRSDSAPDLLAEEPKKKEGGVRPHLPTRIALRMAMRNFARRKFKSAMTFLVATLATSVLVLAQTLVSFNAERALSKTISQNPSEFSYAMLLQRNSADEFEGLLGGSSPFRDDFRDALAEIPYLERYRFSFGGTHLVFRDAEQLRSCGFTLLPGGKEISDDTVYLGRDRLEAMYEYNEKYESTYFVREGEALVPLSKDGYDERSLVGKTIAVKEHGLVLDCVDFPIAGIVESERSYGGADVFCTRGYIDGHAADSFVLEDDELDPHTIVLSGGTPVPFDSLCVSHVNRGGATKRKEIILEGRDEAVSFSEVSLKKGEVVVDERVYNELFASYGNELKVEERLDGSRVLAVPERIGETIEISASKKDRALFGGEFKIVGVFLSAYLEAEEEGVGGVVYFGDEDMREICSAALAPDGVLVHAEAAGEGALYRAFRSLRYDHAVAVELLRQEISHRVYQIEPIVKNVGLAFFAIAVFMIAVTVLTIVNMVSYNILAQKKEIGILRAMGARARDLSKIYFAQALVLSAVTFVLSVAISLSIVYALNALFAAGEFTGLVTFGYTALTWPVLIVGTFGTTFAATAIPLRKISLTEPAEAIKKG